MCEPPLSSIDSDWKKKIKTFFEYHRIQIDIHFIEINLVVSTIILYKQFFIALYIINNLIIINKVYIIPIVL